MSRRFPMVLNCKQKKNCKLLLQEEEKKQASKQTNKQKKETEICCKNYCKTLSAQLCAAASSSAALLLRLLRFGEEERTLYSGGRGESGDEKLRKQTKGKEANGVVGVSTNEIGYTDVKETRTSECGRRPRRRR